MGMTNEEIKEGVNEFVEELVMSVKETESDFIFQTVQPFCENIIQKDISKRDLEQALLQFYRYDKPFGINEWLSTFNTESATECFTAVQELKKRLEK